MIRIECASADATPRRRHHCAGRPVRRRGGLLADRVAFHGSEQVRFEMMGFELDGFVRSLAGQSPATRKAYEGDVADFLEWLERGGARIRQTLIASCCDDTWRS